MVTLGRYALSAYLALGRYALSAYVALGRYALSAYIALGRYALERTGRGLKGVMVVLLPPRRGGNSTTITPFLQIMIYFSPEYALSKSLYMYTYLNAV